MTIHLELSEKELRRLVMAEIDHRLGSVNVKETDVKIEVKSKQNYRSEWEPASFRATVDVTVAP